MSDKKHPQGEAPLDAQDDLPPKSFDEAMPSTNIDHRLTAPDDVRELHIQVETLTKALQEEQEKAASHWERLLRKEADLQNIQRRALQDVENAKTKGIERMASSLLDVLDSFEQGLIFAKSGKASIEDLIQGMDMTYNSLLGAFEKNGIQVIDPQDEPFNPTFHEAISLQESSDIKPNTVVAVAQKGYAIGQRLIRPARVVVSKAPQTAE